MNDATVQSLNHMFDATETATPTADLVPVIDVLPPAPVSEVQRALTTTEDELSPEEIAAKEDFEFSRGAVKSVAAQTQNSLHRAIDVADQTDSARSFEVVADLARATLEAHRTLQELHRTSAEARAATQLSKNPPGTVNVQQGVVFTGTGDDLLRLISKDRT